MRVLERSKHRRMGASYVKVWRAFLSVMVMMGLSACDATAPPPATAMAQGQPFPPLVLEGLNGERASIADYAGRLVILNVWATWCPPCRKELPSLQRLSDTLDPARFVVIGLSVDDEDHVVREYLIDKGVHFTNYLDREGKVVEPALEISVFPDTFFIAPDGTILGRIVGERDWDAAEVPPALEAAWRGEAQALGRIGRLQ